MIRLIALLLVATTNFAFATNRYVSSVNGSTSGTGTQGNPYKNLSQLPALMPGDTVFLERGSLFRESLSVFTGGNSGARLVFMSYGTGAKPIISGADTVTNWTAVGDKYRAAVSGAVYNFFANNREQTLARTPDEGQYYWLDNGNEGQITDAQIPQPSGYWNGARICIHNTQWSWEKTKVLAHSGNSITFADSLIQGCLPGNGYFFYNKDSCLNAPREWYYDSINSFLYFIPQSGSPATMLCEISRRTYGILLQNNAGYVSFIGIAFDKQFNAGIQLGGNSRYVQIINCDFSRQYNYGIQSRGKYHLIDQCVFDQIDGNGIAISSGGNNEIKNCTLKNTGQYRSSGVGGETNFTAVKSMFTDSNYIHHNIIDSAGYCGISADGKRNLVERNIVKHAMMLCNDGAALKSYGGQSQYNVFRNNIVSNSVSNKEGVANPNFETPGIYFDFSVNYSTIENNTIYNENETGIFQNSGTHHNTIRGNVVFGTQRGIDINGGAQNGDTLDNITVMRNTFFALNDSAYLLRQVNHYNQTAFTQGVLDSNFYFQPYASNRYALKEGGSAQSMTFQQWKNYSGQDAHTRSSFSNYSTTTYTPVLFINSSDNDSTFNLGNTRYLDLDSNVICGSITVPAFYSKVLINTGQVCAQGNLNAYILYLHNAGCDNASGKLVAYGTGGTGTYTYLWNNGATTDTIRNLAAGTYVVTVSSGGYTATRSVTIDSFGISGIHIQHACNGQAIGSIYLDNPVAAFPVQYSWFRNGIAFNNNYPFADSLSAATYNWYMTDAEGCVDSGVVFIQSSTPLMEVFVSDSALCWGESVQVWYTPGYTVNYWGIDFNTSTDTLTYTNQAGAGSLPTIGIDSLGCASNDVDPLPFVFMAPHPDPVTLYQYSDTLTPFWGNPISGQAGNTYQWLSNGIELQNSSTPFLIVDTSGFYSCIITNQYGCVLAGTINATYTGLSTEPTNIDAFSIFPNPAQGCAYIVFNEALLNNQLLVYDARGRIVISTELTSQFQRINLSELNVGMYLVKVNAHLQRIIVR